MGDEENLRKNGSKKSVERSNGRQKEQVNRLFGTDWRWPFLLRTCLNWWRVLNLWVRLRNEASEPRMAYLNITKAKKARMSKSQIKSMLICFFDNQEIVHRKFVSQGQIANQYFYQKFLKYVWNQTSRAPGCCITIMCLVTQQFIYQFLAKIFLCTSILLFNWFQSL